LILCQAMDVMGASFELSLGKTKELAKLLHRAKFNCCKVSILESKVSKSSDCYVIVAEAWLDVLLSKLGLGIYYTIISKSHEADYGWECVGI